MSGTGGRAGAGIGETGGEAAAPRDIAPLLDALCAEGLLGGGRRAIVEREHADGTLALEELLIDNGFVDAATLGRLTGEVRAIDLDAEGFVPDARAVARLEGAVARRLRVVPIALDPDGTTLVLASEGAPDLPRRDAVRRALPAGLGIDWRVASASGVARALDRCYGFALALDDVLAACRGADGVARLVDALLSDAVARGASDIHLSPEERFVRVRYRLDGVLSEVRCLERGHLEAMVVRLKVLAGADIAETRRPQDGRFSRRVQGARVDFRLSAFPLATGENVVLRVLERRRTPLALEALSQPPDTLAALRRMVDRPDGLVVVCGPDRRGQDDHAVRVACRARPLGAERHVARGSDRAPHARRAPGGDRRRSRPRLRRRRAGAAAPGPRRAARRRDPRRGELRDGAARRADRAPGADQRSRGRRGRGDRAAARARRRPRRARRGARRRGRAASAANPLRGLRR